MDDAARIFWKLIEIAEAQHEIQNPTSPEKVRLLGNYLELTPESHVLDVASGRGGPAILLAREFGCHVAGIELRQAFHAAAEERTAAAGFASRVRFVRADARELELEREAYDAALCLGATFVWSGLSGTLDALAPAVRSGGYVAVGEPYWRTWPLSPGYPDPDMTYATLPETVAKIDRNGLRLVAILASSEDDWDRYESGHWRKLEEWLREHPDDPDADAIRERHLAFRDHYLRWQRDAMGWAIFVARKL